MRHRFMIMAAAVVLSACSGASEEVGEAHAGIEAGCIVGCNPPPPPDVAVNDPELDSRYDCLDGCKPPPPPPPSALRVVEGVCGAHEHPETTGCRPRASIYEVTAEEMRVYEARYALGLDEYGEPVELPSGDAAPVSLRDLAGAGPLGIKSDVDMTSGAGSFHVREAEGPRMHPETCRWNGFWSAWQCSNIAWAYSNLRIQDGIAWFSLHRPTGEPFFPQKSDGSFTLLGDGDSGYAMQLGFGLISSPLGFAVGALGETYAIEAAQLVPPEPYLEVPRQIRVMNAFGQYIGAIDFPDEADGINDCTLAPDIENGGQALYCTEAGFYQDPAMVTASNPSGINDFAPRCIVYKVSSPQIPALATVTKWLDTTALDCRHANPIDNAPHGTGHRLYFATLGPLTGAQAFTGGGAYAVDMSTKALTKLQAPQTLYDGLAVRRYMFGGTSYDLAVSGIFDRKVWRVSTNGSTAAAEILDLSPYTRQVAGMGCRGNWGGIPSLTGTQCAFGSNRDTILIATKR